MEKEESEILKELQYQNRKKNILVSLILVFFFGPLGLFYTNSIKSIMYASFAIGNDSFVHFQDLF